jgi:hypothetical protein
MILELSICKAINSAVVRSSNKEYRIGHGNVQVRRYGSLRIFPFLYGKEAKANENRGKMYQ